MLWSSLLPSTLTFADIEWEAVASVAYIADQHTLGNDSVYCILVVTCIQ